VTVGTTLALLAACFLLLQHIGSELLPPSDEGEVRIDGEMATGTRITLVDELCRLVEATVDTNVPERQSWVTTVGAPRRGGSFSRMDMRISLVPASLRTRSNIEIANDLRRRLANAIPGMTIRTRAPQGQFLLNRILGGDDGLTVEVRGFDLVSLDYLAQQLASRIEPIDGVTDVRVSSEAGLPQEEIQIDRDKVAAIGLNPRDVARFLETAMAGANAGDYQVDGNAYRILVRLRDAERMELGDILDLSLTTPTGRQVALRNLIETVPGDGPLLIERKDQQRLIRIAVNIANRDTASVARNILNEMDALARPEGFSFRLAGNYEEQQRAQGELLLSLLLALLFVFMVLACQYESLIDPLIVMVSVPMAAIGVLVTLFLTNTTFNLQSYIGCIMLTGIVVNNAILLVDQAGQLVKNGMGVNEAVAEAGRRRLRPILMTTCTTVLALIPLALGIGEGADAQAPLARVVTGGLTGASLITLVLIPVVFSLVHHRNRKQTA
jgi:hydrophobic/amphiphilic exporter-1 (mainly G- bacteria), HAE1 family